jgi:Protein of unknown function (DUF3616)
MTAKSARMIWVLPAVLGCFAFATPAAAKDVVFTGMCDASGAVTLTGGRFAVADDEDSILRVYDATRGGAPLVTADLSGDLHLPHKKKTPETDLEAATRIGDHAFWITSHGRNSKGKKQESRLRLFATTLPERGKTVHVAGQPYTRLLDDLLAAPALARFDLRAAETRPPKEPGGLNIEGMTARPDGTSVILGFRNPVPEGRAIFLPILNPREMIAGQRARLGDPALVDLGGLGVRSISFWRGNYLLVGGGIADERPSKLFRWDGRAARGQALDVDLSDFNPEAFASFEDRPQVLLLSDDGSRQVKGQRCKDLTAPAEKSFRGRWVTLPPK